MNVREQSGRQATTPSALHNESYEDIVQAVEMVNLWTALGKGLVQLAQRSGQFKTLGVRPVHKGEYKGQDPNTGEDEFFFSHDFDNEEVVGYRAYFELINGFQKSLYMTKNQCLAHATKYSQSYKFDKDKTTLWNTEFDTMAEKTVLKLLLKRFAPMSIEMQKAILADQAVVNEDGTYEYVDNEKATKTNVYNSLSEVKEEDVKESEKVVEAEVVDEDFF